MKQKQNRKLKKQLGIHDFNEETNLQHNSIK